MTHLEQIKSLIDPVKETRVLPKFLHWILSDPQYGELSKTTNQKIIQNINVVIDLYDEWLNTGIKPEQDLWLKAKDRNNSKYITAAYCSANAAYYGSHWTFANKDSVANAAANAADIVADANGLKCFEVMKIQVDKLNSLIETYGEDDLFTEDDYEKFKV